MVIRIVINSTAGCSGMNIQGIPCSKAASRWPRIYENLRPSVDFHEFGARVVGGRFGNFCESQKKGVEKIGIGMIGVVYFPR